jgi:DNA-binding FrmR family transcriptional regulator
LALADNINNNQIANIVFDKVIVPHRYVSSLDRIYPPGYACKVLSATYFCQELFMAHTLEEKKKLLNRVRRIMGQVAAIEKGLDQEAECSGILHNISACRGAMDALMAEVIEGHIRYHILGEDGSATDEQARAADDLVSALRAYLK